MTTRAFLSLTVLCCLLSSCSSDAEPAKKTGGSGGAGGQPTTLPNLSTGGHGGGAAGAAGMTAECEFLQLGGCVTQAIEQAVNCLSVDRSGTFADDRTRCTSPEAQGEIAFAAPVRAGKRGYQLDFEVTVAGESCARFAAHDAEPGSEFVETYELTTASHSVHYWLGFQRKLECDGQSFEYAAPDLAACTGSSKLELPMPVVTPSETSVAFEFPRAAGYLSRMFFCSDPE